MSNWVVRFGDDTGRTREDTERAVTEALSAIGCHVLSVRRPMELNPEPLRIKKEQS